MASRRKPPRKPRRAPSARPGRRWLRRLLRPLLKALLVVLVVLAVGPAVVLVAYRFVPVPATPLMVIRAIEGEGWSRDWVPLEEISPHLARAAIAAEDNLFCQHGGIDWQAVQQAWSEYQSGDRLRGASTITMQTARNILLWPGGGFVRKGYEAYIALQMDLFWPKRRIMEVYLNIAEWAPGVYGAEAAAQTHFGRPAAELSRAQAAALAAVLPSPRRWSPNTGSQRARTINGRVDQLGPLLDCL